MNPNTMRRIVATAPPRARRVPAGRAALQYTPTIFGNYPIGLE